MDNENKLKRKLKFYHIFILGCILAIFLMVNSNNVNKRRIADKLDKKQGELFNKIIYGRKLDEATPGDGGNPGQITPEEGEEEEYVFETDVVCQRASEELRNYYNNTATLADLDISEGGISCEDKDKDYIKALISLVKSLIDGGDGSNDDDRDGDDVDNQNSNGNNNNENNENNNPENEGDGGSGLRNLISLDGDTKNNLITYGKSMLPVLIALVLSILCIFGWIICCFCNCCNCCCCCCCKKPGCKIPCFLFTYVFYALVVAVCIYGLTQTNKIFVGLANTECSLLRFFDEILFGEMKTTTPRWAGIEGINSILSELKDVISNMGRSTYQTLESGMENIADEEEAFELNLKNAGTEFYDNGNYKIGTFSKDYTSEGKYIKVTQSGFSQEIPLKGIYALDIISQFGRYVQGEGESSGHYEPEQSVLNAWNLEYSTIANFANEYMEKAREGFQDILTENLEEIQGKLDDAQDKFDELKKPFDDIYDQISSAIFDTSNLIDDYGKKGVKLVFLALALINVLLAFFMLLICICSGKLCTNCCCCRCFCKFWTHLLWNILALLMIVSLLVGSIIALVGKIGGDAMSVISFIISQDNFETQNPLIIDKLGEAKKYLNCCINGDGNLAGQLGIGNSLGSFDQIYTAQAKISEAIQNFTSVRETHLAYNFAKEFFDKRTNYLEDFLLINMTSTDTIPILFSTIIDYLNDNIQDTHRDKWDYENGDKNKICTEDDDYIGDSGSSELIFHPSTCKPNNRVWIKEIREANDGSSNDLLNYADLVSDTVDIINNLPLFKSKIDSLLESYQRYLDSFLVTLNDFNDTISSITGILEEYIGHDSNEAFSFLNGQFISKNLKIVLKYLKYSLGKDLYTVGLCLAVVGCSLIFSISSTILLIVIINLSIDENKMFKDEEDDVVPYETEENLNSNYHKPKRRGSRRRSKRKDYD